MENFDFFNIAKQISTPISLIAFMVAAFLAYQLYKMREKEKLINKANSAKELEPFYKDFNIDVETVTLTPEAAKEVILKQIHEKANLQKIYALLFAFFGLLVFLFFIFYNPKPPIACIDVLEKTISDINTVNEVMIEEVKNEPNNDKKYDLENISKQQDYQLARIRDELNRVKMKKEDIDCNSVTSFTKDVIDKCSILQKEFNEK